MLKAAFQGSGCFQNQLVLLIKNPHDVGNLAGCEILLPDVDVPACAFRRFCSGFPQSPKTLLQGFHSAVRRSNLLKSEEFDRIGNNGQIKR